MFRISEEGFDKKAFLEYAKAKEVEYNKLQHALIKTLAIRTRTRKQIIFEKRIKAELKKLRAQIKELRAQIWVASNKAYKKEDEKKVAEMKCHAFCYVELTKEVKELNTTVHKFETEIARVKGEMLELNKKIVPDEQFQVTIAKYKKLQETLENKLDTNIRREGAVAADNARLRGEIIRLLRDKTYFNEQYTKLVERLNSNKKYLIDLVDYALNSFTQCMTIYDKMDSLVMQRDKDFAARKVEMQNLLRIKEGKDFKMQFLTGISTTGGIPCISSKGNCRMQGYSG
ncbi:uncharacterized protein LOC119666340 [Teleopsis dalmanni]|uniref:uncharacterized protein LOC119666340 n=1 Tax=Teleopsis dalmanni TaxID=139649 RepID=UPI0018CE613B|nr:uncharacterized protein LOC119666340 [Teleopsis dalmanni]